MKNNLRIMYAWYFLALALCTQDIESMDLIKVNQKTSKIAEFVREFPLMTFKRAQYRYNQCSRDEREEIKEKITTKKNDRVSCLFNMTTKLPKDIRKPIITFLFNGNQTAADKFLCMPIADAIQLYDRLAEFDFPSIIKPDRLLQLKNEGILFELSESIEDSVSCIRSCDNRNFKHTRVYDKEFLKILSAQNKKLFEKIPELQTMWELNNISLPYTYYPVGQTLFDVVSNFNGLGPKGRMLYCASSMLLPFAMARIAGKLIYFNYPAGVLKECMLYTPGLSLIAASTKRIFDMESNNNKLRMSHEEIEKLASREMPFILAFWAGICYLILPEDLMFASYYDCVEACALVISIGLIVTRFVTSRITSTGFVKLEKISELLKRTDIVICDER